MEHMLEMYHIETQRYSSFVLMGEQKKEKNKRTITDSYINQQWTVIIIIIIIIIWFCHNMASELEFYFKIDQSDAIHLACAHTPKYIAISEASKTNGWHDNTRRD